ncbi:hypothetical protein Ahy_Scaffold1g107285 [Arachis hypogaea]|uniref:Protein FAR1-RELATED SEQUENCE n=1 Tax=Arachis hypogaea TaxID=3818 RepID=A0A444WV65_ARAHY|nr:hypothetical protein Ahy_Scaffold1g107285 [Arachis hypogaea]
MFVPRSKPKGAHRKLRGAHRKPKEVILRCRSSAPPSSSAFIFVATFLLFVAIHPHQRRRSSTLKTYLRCITIEKEITTILNLLKILKTCGLNCESTYTARWQRFRKKKYYMMKNRKKEFGLKTRTECEHIFYFSDEHNHDLLDTQFSAMLSIHRKMSEIDIMQMMNMLKSGISTSQIFDLLAGMNLLVMVLEMCRMKLLDKGVKFLVMQGKTLISIIPYGTMAIRNVVRDVFFDARHRLCSKHLIRNVSSNIENP